MTVGRAPQVGQGVGQPDFFWLNGLAGGNNHYFQSAVASASSDQAGATQVGIPNSQGIEAMLVEVVTVAVAGDSVMLPQAVAGKTLCMINATANSMDVFASPQVNKATGTTDTINALANAAAYAQAAGTRALYFCAKDGHWGSILSA